VRFADNTKVNRRQFLAALGGLVGVCTLVSACATSAPGSIAPEAGSPTKQASSAASGAATPASLVAPSSGSSGGKKSVVFGGSDVTGNMNPMLVGSDRPGLLMFESLISLDPDTGVPVPNLAQNWDTSADGLTWTFHIRPGVTWSDGQPFTAQDVQFTFDVVNDPKIPTTFRSSVANVAGYAAPDSSTFSVTLKRPECPFLVNTMLMPMIPKHLLVGSADLTTDEFNFTRPVGTGPFIFKEWVRGSHLTLTANPTYWQGPPKIDEWSSLAIANVDAIVASLKLGEIDYAKIQPTFIQDLKDEPNLSLLAVDAPDNLTLLAYNLDRPIFQDKRVRQALTLGLDRKGIVDSQLYGRGTVIDTPLPPQSWAKASGLPALAYDPEAAKRLLSDAGWVPGPDGIVQKDGVRLSFALTNTNDNAPRAGAATIAQDNWRKIGVDLQINNVAPAAFSTKYAQPGPKDFDAIIVNEPQVVTLDPDQSRLLASTEYPNGGNFTHYSNPTVDSLLDQARTVGGCDLNARKAMYAQIQQIMLDDQPFTPLYSTMSTVAVNKRIGNVKPNRFTGSPYLAWGIKDWTIGG
jgi:peptide/nickel transport system substrate-binding protein